MKQLIKKIVEQVRAVWYTAVSRVIYPSANQQKQRKQVLQELPDMRAYDAYLQAQLAKQLAKATNQKKQFDIQTLVVLLKRNYQSLRIVRDYNLSRVNVRERLLSGYTGLCYDPLMVPEQKQKT